MLDLVATVLAIPLVIGFFVVVLGGLWTFFFGKAPSVGSKPPAQPWTPYQSPGAPRDDASGFMTGLVVGHWLGEHHHDHGMAMGLGMGAGDDASDDCGGDDDDS